MRCAQARRLFGACWDDELTQAERDWLESHFSACSDCRREYDGWSRALELASALPRLEPAADLVDRVMARARRESTAPDRVAAPRVRWVPITAAAALAVLALSVVLPWIGPRRSEHVASLSDPTSTAPRPSASAVVAPTSGPVAATVGAAGATHAPARAAGVGNEALAELPDSIFDHSEDVEFILDPVTLRRGRASLSRRAPATTAVQGQQAVITF